MNQKLIELERIIRLHTPNAMVAISPHSHRIVMVSETSAGYISTIVLANDLPNDLDAALAQAITGAKKKLATSICHQAQLRIESNERCIKSAQSQLNVLQENLTNYLSEVSMYQQVLDEFGRDDD